MKNAINQKLSETGERERYYFMTNQKYVFTIININLYLHFNNSITFKRKFK